MTNPSKNKGSAWERAVVEYLGHHGYPDACRLYGAGRSEDEGDIGGVPGFCIEAKAERRIDLAGYMDEAVLEAANIDRRLALRGSNRHTMPVAVVKRRMKGVERAYVVMELADWAELVSETNQANP